MLSIRVLVNDINDTETIYNKFKNTFDVNFVNSWLGQLYDTFKQRKVLLNTDFLVTILYFVSRILC